MKLISDFVERFHNNTLPVPEKCFLLEEGDEIFIKQWLVNGKLNIKVKDLFLWIEKKFYKNNKNLKDTDKVKFEEIKKRFFMDNWRMILLLCDYQIKFRYYTKAINSIKDKSFPEMSSNQFLRLFEKDEKRI